MPGGVALPVVIHKGMRNQYLTLGLSVAGVLRLTYLDISVLTQIIYVALIPRPLVD